MSLEQTINPDKPASAPALCRDRACLLRGDSGGGCLGPWRVTFRYRTGAKSSGQMFTPLSRIEEPALPRQCPQHCVPCRRRYLGTGTGRQGQGISGKGVLSAFPALDASTRRPGHTLGPAGWLKFRATQTRSGRVKPREGRNLAQSIW